MIKNYRFGFYSSITLVITTLMTFALALMAIPVSGAFCTWGCISYPYLNTLSQYPRDYLWMFAAIVQALAYLVFTLSVHWWALDHKKNYAQVGVSFALISTTIQCVCYYLQVTVIPASLKSGETEGIALLTQYNPNGVFIALEELAYLLITFSLLFLAASLSITQRLQLAVRWIFVCTFVIITLTLFCIAYKYGLQRQDRFELVVISVDWLAQIVGGVLFSVIFKVASNQLGNEIAQ